MIRRFGRRLTPPQSVSCTLREATVYFVQWSVAMALTLYSVLVISHIYILYTALSKRPGRDSPRVPYIPPATLNAMYFPSANASVCTLQSSLGWIAQICCSSQYLPQLRARFNCSLMWEPRPRLGLCHLSFHLPERPITAFLPSSQNHRDPIRDVTQKISLCSDRTAGAHLSNKDQTIMFLCGVSCVECAEIRSAPSLTTFAPPSVSGCYPPRT